jgi:hypothetical protein
MSSMSSMLGEIFGTKTAAAVTHTDEDVVKEASLQFFGALCAQEGIDVNQLSDEQATELFKVAMAIKEAKEEEGEEAPKAEKKEEGGKAPPFGKKHEAGESKEKEEKEEKKEAAVAEWAEKRASAVKVAEAVAQGQIMAHAFVAELQKVAAQMNGEQPAEPAASSQEKAAAIITAFNQMKTAAPIAANTATPNFDELAAVRAIDMLKQAEYDENLAFQRIQAVFTLGLAESTKIASVADPDTALTVRAYEFCEAAGFPVDWSAV